MFGAIFSEKLVLHLSKCDCYFIFFVILLYRVEMLLIWIIEYIFASFFLLLHQCTVDFDVREWRAHTHTHIAAAVCVCFSHRDSVASSLAGRASCCMVHWSRQATLKRGLVLEITRKQSRFHGQHVHHYPGSKSKGGRNHFFESRKRWEVFTHTLLLVLFVDAGFVYKRARDSTLLHPGSN